MKSLKVIATLSLAVIIISYIPSPEISITGHVRNNESSHFSEKSLHIFVEGDNRYLNKSLTNAKGNFTLDFTDSDQDAFDFYCYSQKSDTILLASIKSFKSDEPEITFYIPRPADKLCPVCKQSDKVYQLIYSNSKSDQFTPTNTKYYCSRNKFKFK